MLTPPGPDIEALVRHPALGSDLEFAALLRDPALRPAQLELEGRRVRALLAAGGQAFASEQGFCLLRPLPWDSDHFGFPCADLTRWYRCVEESRDRMEEARDLDAQVTAVLEACRDQGVRLLSARIPAGWIAGVQALEAAGMRLCDTSVELGVRLPLASKAPSSEVVVRASRPEDHQALADIGASFTGNRFHRDPRIPVERASGVYRQWALAAARGEHGRLLLCEVRGRPAALATYYPVDEALGIGIMALVVVHQEFRGLHLLDSLVHGCAQALGGRYLCTSTQVSNSAALRAFGRHGLLPHGARHIFHLWL